MQQVPVLSGPTAMRYIPCGVIGVPRKDCVFVRRWQHHAWEPRMQP
jgi:hypothetical protein